MELHAFQLPGRESRFSEPAYTDSGEASVGMADAIEPYLDRPYAVFGYSMGALLGFELVRELRRRGAPMPEKLFVAARVAPQLHATHPPLAQLPREQFIEQVRYFYQPPEEAWSNSHLLELILPVLRADMLLCESYTYQPEAPLDCGIQAFAGRNDRSSPISKVLGWREQSKADFDLEVFNGAHFFINKMHPKMQNSIISSLDSLAG